MTPGTTLIYPEAIRNVVRERFPEEEAGAYDHQYTSSGSVSISHEGAIRYIAFVFGKAQSVLGSRANNSLIILMCLALYDCLWGNL